MKRLILITAIGLIASGCTRTVDTACSSFTPITYSAINDTAETVRQIKENNAVWVSLCKKF